MVTVTEIIPYLFWGIGFMLSLVVLAVGIYQVNKQIPEGLSFEGQQRPVEEVRFLRDISWVDELGKRHCDQQIFDAVMQMIRFSRKLVLLDMFLFNEFAGKGGAPHRRIVSQLANLLMKHKHDHPDSRIIFITDPVNTIYGGLENSYLEQMSAAGIEVIETRLDVLPDSNLVYSPFWRVFFSWFGNAPGSLLPNPLGPGRVSVRSYLRMFNFKANHRKLVVTDCESGYSALVTSANAHDASSAHGNVAVQFTGKAVVDLLQSESAVPGFSKTLVMEEFENESCCAEKTSIQVLTEGKIKKILLAEINGTVKGDMVDIIMFYLTDREVVQAIKRAFLRGVAIRILLDPNKDAFGRSKGGMPNRQVASELHRAGILVRWAVTSGEQMHSKLVMVKRAMKKDLILLGSANLTRRNLEDFNLETDIAVRGTGKEKVFTDCCSYFELLWHNPDQRKFSMEYDRYADNSAFRNICYRLLEASGMCTF